MNTGHRALDKREMVSSKHSQENGVARDAVGKGRIREVIRLLYRSNGL